MIQRGVTFRASKIPSPAVRTGTGLGENSLDYVIIFQCPALRIRPERRISHEWRGPKKHTEKLANSRRLREKSSGGVAGVKRRRVTTSRWQAHALGEFDDAVRVARRDGVT